MRNLRNPWGAYLGAGAGKERPLLSWWQAVLRSRQVAIQMRRRARRMHLLSLLDLAKERSEARARTLAALRTRLQKSIEDPSSSASPYDIREPVEAFNEPFDTADVTDEPIVAEHDYSYLDDDEKEMNNGGSKKPAKATKKRSKKRASKKRATKKS
jgi:hypothetical protein